MRPRLWYKVVQCSRWSTCGGAGDGFCRSHSATINIFPFDTLSCDTELCINKRPLHNDTMIYLSSHRCVLFLQSIVDVLETGLHRTQRMYQSLTKQYGKHSSYLSPPTTYTSSLSNDYTLYTCMAFLRTLTGAFMVKRHQIYDNPHYKFCPFTFSDYTVAYFGDYSLCSQHACGHQTHSFG
jgi:hypothetical protein